MSRLTRDRTAEPVSRDQILGREREQGNIHFSCSADHEQDWQPYPVDPYSSYMCEDYDHTYIHMMVCILTPKVAICVVLDLLYRYLDLASVSSLQAYCILGTNIALQR